MDALTKAFGPAVPLVFTYTTDLEEGGNWIDLDPAGEDISMPLINVSRRTDGIHGVRIKKVGMDIVQLDVFVNNLELKSPTLELIAAEAITAAFGYRCEVVIGRPGDFK